MVEKLRQKIEAIELRIGLLWDDKSQPIEERGREINRLSKKRFELECKLQDLNLRKLGFA